jgi:hypothetical protein
MLLHPLCLWVKPLLNSEEQHFIAFLFLFQISMELLPKLYLWNLCEFRPNIFCRFCYLQKYFYYKFADRLVTYCKIYVGRSFYDFSPNLSYGKSSKMWGDVLTCTVCCECLALSLYLTGASVFNCSVGCWWNTVASFSKEII